MDTARGGAGRLVEHANTHSCCIQLDSGRSLDQIIRDYSRSPAPFLTSGDGDIIRMYHLGTIFVQLRGYDVLIFFSFFSVVLAMVQGLRMGSDSSGRAGQHF